jgi:hypothetical protein
MAAPGVDEAGRVVYAPGMMGFARSIHSTGAISYNQAKPQQFSTLAQDTALRTLPGTLDTPVP